MMATTTAYDAFAEWSSYDWDRIADRDERHELYAAAENVIEWKIFDDAGTADAAAAESLPRSNSSRKHRRRTLDGMFRDVEWDDVANSLREEQLPSSCSSSLHERDEGVGGEREESRLQQQPPAINLFALSFRHADRHTHDVCRLQNATRMSIYDELFWLVFIAVRGQAEFEHVTSPNSVLPAARFLTTQKMAVHQLQQQQALARQRCTATTTNEDQVATAFLSQPSGNNTRKARMLLKLWCRHNLSFILQWYADFFGRPIAFVHRGKGWCAEVFPSAANEGPELDCRAEYMRAHQWTPAANTVVLYLYDYSPVAQFGVELTLERIRALPWAQNLVRMHSFAHPLGKNLKLYQYSDLQLLYRRILCNVTAKVDDGDDGDDDPDDAVPRTKKKGLLHAALTLDWLIF